MKEGKLDIRRYSPNWFVLGLLLLFLLSEKWSDVQKEGYNLHDGFTGTVYFCTRLLVCRSWFFIFLFYPYLQTKIWINVEKALLHTSNHINWLIEEDVTTINDEECRQPSCVATNGVLSPRPCLTRKSCCRPW